MHQCDQLPNRPILSAKNEQGKGQVDSCPWLTQRRFVRYEVPTVMAMNSTVLWDATSPKAIYTNILWKDGGTTCPRNNGTHLPSYIASYPTAEHSSFPQLFSLTSTGLLPI
jgi:hypothetical protein